VTLSPHWLAFIAIFVLSVMDALIKGMSAEFGTLQIVLMRFLAGALVMVIVFTLLFPGRPSWETMRVNGLRGFLVVFTALSFFYGLSTLPLAEALALSFLSPIFIAVMGVVLLKETVGARIIIGLVLGMLGMMVMVYGLQTDEAGPRPALGVAAAIASAFSYGLAIVLLRARATRDPVVTIVLIQHVMPSVIVGLLALMVWVFINPSLAAIPAALAFHPFDLADLGWFLVLGLCGAVGHLILATAFSRAEAASLAPLDYTSLIWAVLFGYVFFNETPGLSTLLGAALIAAGAAAASRSRPAASAVESS
jgi:drug/metabolite transporter (DMT)-like permease